MRKNIFNKIISTGLIAAMALSGNMCIYAKESNNNYTNVTEDTKQATENCVIDCNNKFIYDKVCSIVDEDAITDSAILEENNVIALRLSEDEKEKIMDLGISVEDDDFVEGSVYDEEFSADDEGTDRDDWNMRSIEVVPEEKDESKEKIKIAIIDSGIDFNENINVVERKNFLDDDVLPLYEDNTGHGTAIAGIIASDGCNNTLKGINPNVEIYSARVLDDNNKAPVSRIAEAIYWAIDEDVNIINMSFGTKKYSEVLHKAVKAAEEKGILMFAASGNEGNVEDSNVEYPAAFKDVVAVGAASKAGEISEITSRGKELELVAPGEEIDSVGWLGMDVVCNGTSMAVPHAVGVASLLWQRDTTKSAQFIRELMKISSKTVTDEEKEYSYIDYAYADSIYDDFCCDYQDDNCINENDEIYSNEGEVASYENEVEARWSKAHHADTVDYAQNNAAGLTSTQVKIVKLGAKAPDVHCPAKVFPSHKMLHAMGAYNYVKVYEQVMNMAIKCKKSGHNAALLMGYPDGNPGDYGECETARSWLGEKEIKVMLEDYPYNNKNAALIMMGVAMHIVGDTFAHKAGVYVKGENVWKPLQDAGYTPDNIDDYPNRWKCAREACTKILSHWNGNSNPCLKDYALGQANGNWKLERFKTFCLKASNGYSYTNSFWNKVYGISYAD